MVSLRVEQGTSATGFNQGGVGEFITVTTGDDLMAVPVPIGPGPVVSRRSQGSAFSVVVAIAGRPPPASAGKCRGPERRVLRLIYLSSVFFVTVAFVESGRVRLAIEWAFAEP